MIDKVAIVTGANKGIGFAIVKELCTRGVKTVYLTARDEGRGRKAVSDLKAEGLYPEFHLLDVKDVNSIKKLAAHLKKVHGGVDMLINNAGRNQLGVNYAHVNDVIDTNFKSILLVNSEFFPILKQNARVINVSSSWGHCYFLRNSHWMKILSKEDITIDDVNAFVRWYLESVKNKSLTDKDFLNETCNAYKVSKMAMNAATKAQQQMLDREDKRNISINAVYPGSVRTDATSDLGNMSIEEAAIAPVYLALDVDQSVKGKFLWYDKEIVDWTRPITMLKIIPPIKYGK